MRLHAKAARRSSTVVALVALLACGALFAPAASAAPKSLLRTIGSGSNGTEGGLFNSARGVAVNQETGDLYVADGGNSRIQQFNGDGDFIRAWGTDVIALGKAGDTGTGFEVCEVAADCKAGTTAGGVAGQVAQPMGLAIDQTNGYLYVTSNTNRRVDVFSAEGEFAGAFGWDVANTGDPGDTAPVNQLEVCTTVCKQGATGGPDAGRISGWIASDPSIDPSAPAGTIYVPDSGTNLRVSEFATTISAGELTSASFLKAFGWDVAPGAVDEEQELRVKATAGQFTLGFGADTTAEIAFNASAAEVQAALNALPSIEAGGGSVTVSGGPGNASGSNLYVVRFNGGSLAGSDVAALTAQDGTTPLSGGTPSAEASVRTRANGGASTGLESCTVASGCKVGVSGGELGQFVTGGSPSSSSVDSTGAIYVASGPLQTNSNCAPATPCRVYKFDPATGSASILGPDVTAGKVGEAAALDVAVDPANDNVLVARRVASGEFQLFEYDSGGTLVETHPATPLTSASTTATHGLEVGAEERLYASQAGPSVYLLGEVPKPPPPVMRPIDPVTDISATGATFHGEVTVASKGSTGFDTSWRFEYSANGSKWTLAPTADAILGSTPGTYPVERSVAGLEPNAEYVVRLAATSASGTARSEVAEFTTATEKPSLDSVFSISVSPTEMILGAEIDANRLSTTYHLEWGAEAGVYPNRVPAFERHIGSGSSAVATQESISGLQPNTTYHFRVIAENAAGETISQDQQLLTPNAAGMAADRGFELVSPANKRPVGNVEKLLFGRRYYQAAEQGSAFSYPVFNGLESSTAGGIVAYNAVRTADGWRSSQVTPASTVPAPTPVGPQAIEPGSIHHYSADLGCAVLKSFNPVTADTPEADVANGVENLYRWRAADGAYTLITRSPLNPTAPTGVHDVVGTTPDCSRVLFRSRGYTLIPGATGLYEWDEGVLRDAGLRPDGSTPPAPVGALAGEGSAANFNVAQERNTVSRDGRLFFIATSNEAADSGKRAVYVRKGPGEVVNASKPTHGPSLGAKYQLASPDGSRVFFLANYGIAATSSAGPIEDCSAVTQPGTVACDLYEYDVEAGALTDVSASADPDNPRGAVVQGVLDVSEDGSTVYFAARGQLVPGKGRSYAENVSGDAFANVYRYREGELSYVGMLDGPSMRGAFFDGALVGTLDSWAAQTTRSGDHLLFSSRLRPDGSPGNSPQAYVYSAHDESTVCISCPKGRPAGARADIQTQLHTVQAVGAGNYTPRSLSDEGRVLFTSADALTPDAQDRGEGLYADNEERALENAGETNVYEWHRGQLSLLAAGKLRMVDISADGTDVYIRSYEQLVPEDIDFAPDIYDIRIGSVTPAPVIPEAPCDPGADQCQGAPTPTPASPSPASSRFSGSGNPPPPAARKAKKNKKKAKRNRRKSRRAKQRRQRAKAKARARKRAAKTNRGGAK